MDDVIENCQTTFEEDGVNQQTLEDLRSVGFPCSLAIVFAVSIPYRVLLYHFR